MRSASSRVIDHLSAMSSALIPWGTRLSPYRARSPGDSGSPGPGTTLENIGTRVIDSTPPATTTS